MKLNKIYMNRMNQHWIAHESLKKYYSENARSKSWIEISHKISLYQVVNGKWLMELKRLLVQNSMLNSVSIKQIDLLYTNLVYEKIISPEIDDAISLMIFMEPFIVGVFDLCHLIEDALLDETN